MRSYTIHLPAGSAGATADATMFVPDGFSARALVFGPFWLLWHRQWLGFAGYLVLFAGIVALTRLTGLNPLAASLLTTLLNLLVALEGGQLRRWGLSRAGRPAVAVVNAADEAEAAIRYFTALAEADRSRPRPPPPTPGEPPPSAFWAPRPSGIIGLFPEQGGR